MLKSVRLGRLRYFERERTGPDQSSPAFILHFHHNVRHWGFFIPLSKSILLNTSTVSSSLYIIERKPLSRNFTEMIMICQKLNWECASPLKIHIHRSDLLDLIFPPLLLSRRPNSVLIYAFSGLEICGGRGGKPFLGAASAKRKEKWMLQKFLLPRKTVFGQGFDRSASPRLDPNTNWSHLGYFITSFAH